MNLCNKSFTFWNDWQSLNFCTIFYFFQMHLYSSCRCQPHFLFWLQQWVIKSKSLTTKSRCNTTATPVPTANCEVQSVQRSWVLLLITCCLPDFFCWQFLIICQGYFCLGEAHAQNIGGHCLQGVLTHSQERLWSTGSTLIAQPRRPIHPDQLGSTHPLSGSQRCSQWHIKSRRALAVGSAFLRLTCAAIYNNHHPPPKAKAEQPCYCPCLCSSVLFAKYLMTHWTTINDTSETSIIELTFTAD